MFPLSCELRDASLTFSFPPVQRSRGYRSSGLSPSPSQLRKGHLSRNDRLQDQSRRQGSSFLLPQYRVLDIAIETTALLLSSSKHSHLLSTRRNRDSSLTSSPLFSPFQQHKPSALVDLETGRPIEIEVTIGSILRMGRRVGRTDEQMTILRLVYGLMKVVQKVQVDGYAD